MQGPRSRRTFLRDGTVATAALTAGLSATPRGARAAGPDKVAHVCAKCGAQFPETEKPPERCPLCSDERQWVAITGQTWTTLDAIRATHENSIEKEEEDLYSINTSPKYGVGQRAFLIRTPGGNVLWDCVPLIDDATVKRIQELGGIKEIAISHPHYYTTMVDWSRAFDDAPIHIHELDRPWVTRPDPCVRPWDGKTKTLVGGLSLVHTGGHFEGYQVLHWPGGAGGRGVLMAGDQPQVCMDPEQVSFMWSYPNYIPLNAPIIEHVMTCLDPLKYDRVYGSFAFRGRHGLIVEGGKELVRRCADRYLRAVRA